MAGGIILGAISLLGEPFFLLAACFIGVLFYAIKHFSKDRGPSPLWHDYRRPAEPFVHDKKARDAVLKQNFKPTKIPEKLDAIVVGSGIGGLTTAVLLGRAGRRVLVLEQHDQAGGCCHSFVEKGFEFDTGVHYIGDVQEGRINRTLLDQLTEGQLRWTEMDDTFDVAAIGPSGKAKMFPMKSGKSRYAQNLVDMFPKEEAAIKEYMKLIKDASGSFFGIAAFKILPRFVIDFLVSSGLYRVVFSVWRKGFAETSLQEVLDRLTDNKDLKCVLSYLCFDYGVVPRDVPFVLHAVVINHYMHGAFYPTNGTSEFAFHMCNAITKQGGCVLVNAPVSQIICDDKGRATGVTVGGKTSIDINAEIIVSDAGVINTFKKLLPKDVAQASRIYPLIDKVGPSISYITAFIGVEGSASELKIPACNYWLYDNNDINKQFDSFTALNADEIEDAEIPFGYISCPSAKDSEWETKIPGKTSIMSIILAKWDWFKEYKDEKTRHRGERYEGVKDVMGRRLWQQVVDVLPQVEGKRVYMEVGTPVTNSFYLGQGRGEMYGLSQGMTRFTGEVVSKLRADTDIPGLYLTGQDVLVCGLCAALFAGVITASKVLQQDLYSDLLRLNSRLYPKNKASAEKQSKTD